MATTRAAGSPYGAAPNASWAAREGGTGRRLAEDVSPRAHYADPQGRGSEAAGHEASIGTEPDLPSVGRTTNDGVPRMVGGVDS